MTNESVHGEAPPPVIEGGAHEHVELQLGNLVKRLVIGFLLLVGVVALLTYFFRDPLNALSVLFVKTLGGFGVALGWYLVDAFTFPLPNDAFSFFGFKGGMGFWVVVSWAFLGSIAGGMTAYGIGLLLRQNKRFLLFLEGRGAEAYGLIKRYGLLALLIAALTPVPYSISSYACGVVRSHFGWFLLISVARFPRIALYLWLIQRGTIAIGS